MYIGNDLQIAHPSYKIIDDISSGFNGSATSFALNVSGATPVPFPISTQQVMISVNGVVQEPDPSGSAGFKLLGSNIVFSSAPANGHAFFGVINAGADYVTAGSEFPDGSATAPSFTFQDDQDTGWFRSGSGAVGYSANGVQTLTFDGNGLTVTGDASFVGDSAKNLLWDKSDGALEFADNAKAVFGAGSDLTIYHNGTNSIIGDTGAGELSLQTNGTGIRLWNSADGETLLNAINNGAVELYHNNAKKLETTSSGCQISNGNLNFLGGTNDAQYIKFGDSGDDDIGNIFYYHGNNNMVFTTNTSEKLRITDTGLVRVPDNGKFTAGQGDDLQIYHNGSDSYIKNTTGDTYITGSASSGVSKWLYIRAKSDEQSIICKDNGAVELYYDNSKKFETTSSGILVTGLSSSGNTVLGDNVKSLWGTGEDLQVWHDGTDSKIVNNTGVLYTGADNQHFMDKDFGDYFAKFIHDGAVELYHDNSKKIETTSSGVTVTGTVTDSKGDLRKIVQNTQGSTYTLVAADAGKHILASGTITVPDSVFSAGDAVTIVNNTGGDLTITKTITTMYLGTDASSANRTLSTRGVATILFASGTVAYISGAGLS